jgi:uncharacterized tellurite resistance protein B-like protein
MLDRIKALFAAEGRDASEEARVCEVQLAAAALLVKAAHMDEDFDAGEESLIVELLRQRFELNETEARSLLALAERRAGDSVQLLEFTRIVKDRFDHDERIEMLEMLWEVVYSDGRLHDHEASLMRRVSGLLFVSDQESGSARKRALARLGH